jgi:hypothetical protein
MGYGYMLIWFCVLASVVFSETVYIYYIYLFIKVINVGKGSYSSEPPTNVWDEDYYGFNYRMFIL